MPSVDTFLPSLSFPGKTIGPVVPAVGTITAVPATACPTAFPGLKIQFPGASVEVTNAMNKLKGGCDLIGDTLTPIIQAITTALKPIFDLLELVQKIIDCITAIPDAIANANPDPVIKCIPGLAEKLAEILAYLFPAISVPPFVADVLCVVKTLIECMIQQVEALIAFEAKIEAVAKRIEDAGADFLQHAKDSAMICRSSLVENLAGSAKPLAPLLKIVNSFVKLVPNMPTIPTLGDLTKLPLDQIGAQLEQFKTILGTIPDTCVLQEGQ